MSEPQTPPSAPEGSSRPQPAQAPAPDLSRDAAAEPRSDASETAGDTDPLRRSRVSHIWVSVVVFAVMLVLLIVFFAQNTDRVAVRFFGWTWHAPLAVVLLSGVVAGMILTVVAGTLRILQLRRRVRRSS